MTAHLPKNAYTDAPEQHPNLILGSLQLLFWLVFRPSAWRNYTSRFLPLRRVFLFRLKERNWRQAKVWKFLIQGLVLLPLFASLVISCFVLISGNPIREAIIGLLCAASLGVVLCVTGSLIGGFGHGIAYGVAYSAASIFGSTTETIAGSIAGGIAAGVSLGTLGGATGRIFGIAFSVIFGVAFGVSVNVLFGVVFGVSLLVNWWRPICMSAALLPWHSLILSIDQRRYTNKQHRMGQHSSLLHRHIAFWDEWQYLPVPGLDKHLLLVLEHSHAEGQAALDYLSTSHQRWAAKSAQIELDARQLQSCDDAIEIGKSHRILTVSELSDSADALLRSFNRISKDVDAALNQASAYNQRLALNAVGDRLDGLLRELTRSSDKYAVRFRPIAQRWCNIIKLELDDLTKTAELRQEIDSPYIIGVPLTERQEIFVGRTDISARIEQLLLDRRRPPLLLYGQRRTGKTSLLNNLGRLLPNSIIPLFVDLQGPASRASNPVGFLYNLAKGMTDSAKRQRQVSLPALSRELLSDDPFTRFDEWLDDVEKTLQDNTALLALDEFEVLDQALVEGRFSETDVLGMLRNLIQHRPQFKVLLSGSHTLEEFQRWSSYLINAQVLHLGYLKEAEARQLIERPVKDFALRYQPDASQRVLDLTRGHPFLVQLLCAEIVVLKNEQDPSIRRLATLADVEAAIPEALSSGSMFFSDIERNQIDAPTLAVLRHMANQGEGAIISQSDLRDQFPEGQFSEQVEKAINLLLRRELIEMTADGDRIQVELIRRWFDRR